MEAKLGFSGFTAYRSVFKKIFTLTQSQDSVVPDTLPDIASIDCCSGCALIRSKEVADGHVRLEANVPARVCCSGEDGGRFCLDVNIPFYLNAEDASIPEGGACVAELSVRRLEARLLNPRKISVRAELGINLNCFAQNDETFCTAPEAASDSIHAREQEAELTAVGSVTEKTFVLTDEYTLPAGSDVGGEIVSQHAEVTVQEVRSIGTKLIVKGSVCSRLLCMDESGELRAVVFTTSFSQIVETEADTEDTLCDARLLISGMYYELIPTDDGTVIQMDLHMAAQVIVYARFRVRCLADAYSNLFALKLQRQTRDFTLFGREVTLRDSFPMALDTAGETERVIACRVTPTAFTQGEEECSVQLLADLCWETGGSVRSMQRTLTRSIPTLQGGEAVRVSSVSVTDLDAVPVSVGAELRITLELRAFTVRKMYVDSISAVEYDEAAPRDLDGLPSLVILYPGCQGELWTLAKENCSTVEAICAANGIEEDADVGDQLLLIPKTI